MSKAYPLVLDPGAHRAHTERNLLWYFAKNTLGLHLKDVLINSQTEEFCTWVMLVSVYISTLQIPKRRDFILLQQTFITWNKNIANMLISWSGRREAMRLDSFFVFSFSLLPFCWIKCCTSLGKAMSYSRNNTESVRARDCKITRKRILLEIVQDSQLLCSRIT